MRHSLLVMAGALALLVGGCLTLSIHPLYTMDDVIAVPEAAGVWSNPEDGGRWTFVPEEDQSFTVTTEDDENSTSEFEGWFVRVGGDLYLDLYPTEAREMSEFRAVHFIPVHSFWRVTLSGEALTLEYIDLDKFEDAIERGAIDIPHTAADDLMILTAETPELQTFFGQHMDNLVSDDPFVLKREP